MLPLDFVGTEGFGRFIAASPEERGAASFMTIFACISSSFAALTFLGQNNVTNLVIKMYESGTTDIMTGKLTSIDGAATYRYLLPWLFSALRRGLFYDQ